MNDTLGNRLKFYEAMTEIQLMPLLPIVARIDGRTFHTFTKGMKRPYDEQMTNAMVSTAKRLAESTDARIAYTQSDEITLIWYSDNTKSQTFFNGRHSKLVSNLASMATLYFYQEVLKNMPEYASRNTTFDCRVFSVPTVQEACNVLVWRELDATKNAVSQASRAFYSDRECLGKNSSDKQEMLFQKGVNFNDYPDSFKRGTYIIRKQTETVFTAEEIENLPSKHAARTNPGLKVRRQMFVAVNLPVITRIANVVDVVFNDAEPVLKG